MSQNKIHKISNKFHIKCPAKKISETFSSPFPYYSGFLLLLLILFQKII